MRDADAHRRLAALVLVDLDEARDALHVGALEAGRDDLLDGLVLLHVARQDGVEHLVGRQAVLVGLVGRSSAEGGRVMMRCGITGPPRPCAFFQLARR